MRLAVFASGHGSNLEAIAAQLPVALVFSDRPSARALTVVPDAATVSFSPGDFAERIDYEEALAEMVREHQIDYVALAGYMRLVGRPLLEELPGRIINIHPSLLPAFPGKDAIGQAFAAQVPLTGVTVHYIDAGMDTGPVIAQESVPMAATLADLTEAIHLVEYQLYPRVLRKIWEEAQ